MEKKTIGGFISAVKKTNGMSQKELAECIKIPKNNEKSRKSDIGFYLLCILSFWLFTFVTLNFWLKPHAIFYEQSGKMTFGYLGYAVIGEVFCSRRLKRKCRFRLVW